jgi:hypothetical protein
MDCEWQTGNQEQTFLPLPLPFFFAAASASYVNQAELILINISYTEAIVRKKLCLGVLQHHLHPVQNMVHKPVVVNDD